MSLHCGRSIQGVSWQNNRVDSVSGCDFFPSDLSSLPSYFIQVLIRRRPLLYVVGLLIPSIFLMLVDVISFYLPLNSGTRIAFKISILLGYTVFRVNMTDELPSTAVSTPLIGGILFII